MVADNLFSMEDARTTGRGTHRCLQTGTMPSLLLKVAEGWCRHKLLIFRRLPPKFMFFTPFLSCKALVSRQLWVFRGFFYLRQAEPAPMEMRNSECGEFGRAVRKTGGAEGFGCS